ncbi:hypothetical protein C3941_23635 [Kaistia algarum]|uniref:DUF2303 family protein n=1 Tax=Kaistia algarum TaxID=2083279 RepID=UPI000CE8DFA1|nr:DUF2303 family protein [Kaistia algarum]MCX5513450.1 DUF2303 family protein [Kaistia algarum]PPE77452.1 hypothetical protein C3941_23635 [Kaistia algarum]
MAEKSLNDIPLASATELIMTMAAEASTPVLLDIETQGLGDGLPKLIPILFDRKSQRVIDLKPFIESARQEPARRKGTAKAETLKSFIDLIERHKDDRSAIFAATSWPNPKLTAVLNYNTAQAPHWNDHRIVYEFPLTEEFSAWIKGDSKPMEQVDFAAFLEEHAAELSAPFDGEVSEYEALFKEHFATPSEVVALSRHLEVFIGAKAKQGIRLQTGERQIEFSEEHLNSKGEKVDIPGIFMVSVPAFLNGDAVRIPARLRYRIAGGTIKWFYQLYRWEFWLRTEVQHALAKAGNDTALPIFEGAPEGSS